MSETIRNINLIIGDRPYKLKVGAEEEEMVRKAAKLIKEKLVELKQTYQAKDKQDYLAMAALIYCVESLKSQGVTQDQEFSEQLSGIDEMLSVFLENNQ